MTAEVAIINKIAVAVAADSAVTVGKSKVHQTANKIFAICDNSAIGIMVYGHAEFGGVPWETLIKVFRQENVATKFSTVADCYKAFRLFLADARFFDEDAQDKNMVLFFNSFFESLRKRALRQAEEKDDWSKKYIASILPALIQKTTDQLSRASGDMEFKAPSLDAFRRKAANTAWLVAQAVFEDPGYKLSQSLKKLITDMAFSALSCPNVSDYATGVVVFGFGDSEVLPSLVAHEVDGCCFGQIRTVKYVERFTTKSNVVAIIPFADREDVQVFVEGIHPAISEYMYLLMTHTAKEIAKRVVKENFSPTEEEYAVIQAINNRVISKIMSEFSDKVSKYIREERVVPLLDVVRGLPKEEMATLAEALVEITALKKHVSMQVESVGGPIDVCIVTKGDGLIWIKRKHYFDLDKNIYFLHNRFGNLKALGVGGKND